MHNSLNYEINSTDTFYILYYYTSNIIKYKKIYIIMHRIERYPDWKEKKKPFTYVLIVDVKLYKILEQNYLPLGKCYLYAIIHFEWDFK